MLAAEGLGCKLAAALAADGYVVVRDALTPEQLQHLRAECDALCAALEAEGVQLADEGCVADAFRRGRPAPHAAARTCRAAYAAARRAALASICGGAHVEQRSAAVEQAVLESLPNAVLRALGAGAALHLFNEQYVVKPARSACSFAWHRDAEEQLSMCTPGDVCAPPYYAVWAPLDDCSSRNGTLVVLPGFAPWESEQAADSRRVVINVPAGAACVFSSELWHASGCNDSDAPRRVLYVQFSASPIVSLHDRTPLSFAVPVAPGAAA